LTVSGTGERVVVGMKRTLSYVVPVTALFLCCAAPAFAARPQFRISSSSITLKEEGLKVRLIGGGEPRPLSSPNVHTMRSREGTFDAYDARELWYRGEHLGRWMDSSSNAQVLAMITTPFPTTMLNQLVTRDDFSSAVQSIDNVYEWDVDRLSGWIETFAGISGITGTKALRCPMGVEKLIAFEYEGSGLAYALLFKQSTSFPVPRKWYFIHFELNPQVDRNSAAERVEKQFMPYVDRVSWTSKQTGHSKRMQAGKQIRESDRTDEFKASRAAVIESLRNMKDWWYVETKNYLIVSDLKSQNRELIRRMQTDVEYLRAAFEQFMPPLEPIEQVSVIRVFENADEYLEYVGDRFRWTQGLWFVPKRELVARAPAVESSQKIAMQAMLGLMYHEAFHQYLFYALDHRSASVWFNEGHATFFGSAEVSRNRLVVGEDRQRAAKVTEMARKREIDIEGMLHKSYVDFYRAGDDDEGGEERSKNYALAWGMVYYLRKGIAARTRSEYASILDAYGEALRETRDPDVASAKAFEGIDMRVFEKDFIEFWLTSSLRREAEWVRIFKDYKSGK